MGESGCLPLRDIVAELIRMIDQRQRGLDAAHHVLRKEITELVDSAWADAIDTCVAMIRRVDRGFLIRPPNCLKRTACRSIHHGPNVFC